MRFERLFADLDAQLQAAELVELESEVAERTRRERAKITLAGRMRASAGSTVRVRVNGVGTIEGAIRSVGADWVLLREPAGADVLVRAAAILDITRLARGAREPSGDLASRIDLRRVLRGLARDRTPVGVILVDGSMLVGTLAGVGADAVDLVETTPEEAGDRAAAWSSADGPLSHLLTLSAIAAIRER